VNQRVREIGVRIALGARTMNVLELIIGQTLRQAAVGAAIGSLMALGAARVLAANVQSMPTFDAVAFVSAFVIVVLSCLVAAFIPSHRAAAVDPTVALRHD